MAESVSIDVRRGKETDPLLRRATMPPRKVSSGAEKDDAAGTQPLRHRTRTRGVFGMLFSALSKVSPKRRQDQGDDAKRRTRKHSLVFDILDPSSHSHPARCYKVVITNVILLNVVCFILSTDDAFEKRFHGLFAVVEAVSSLIFLVEYITRIVVVTEHKQFRQPVKGRLKYMATPSAVIDAVATFPFFIEKIFGRKMPYMVPLRCLRLARILKSEKVVQATASVWRVITFNHEIMTVALTLACILTLVTATLLFYLQPHQGDDQFKSIPATIFLAVLMLTGQGGPEGDLPWYTKLVVLMTAIFSVAMFAIPASMLTWGFEAEAERLARKSRGLRKQQAREDAASDSSDGEKDFGTWFFMSHKNDDDWIEYEDVILGSDSEGSNSDGEGEVPLALPTSPHPSRNLELAYRAVLHLDPDNVTPSMIEELKEVAQMLRSDASVPSPPKASEDIRSLRGLVTQLHDELQAVRNDLSTLRRDVLQAKPS